MRPPYWNARLLWESADPSAVAHTWTQRLSGLVLDPSTILVFWNEIRINITESLHFVCVCVFSQMQFRRFRRLARLVAPYFMRNSLILHNFYPRYSEAWKYFMTVFVFRGMDRNPIYTVFWAVQKFFFPARILNFPSQPPFGPNFTSSASSIFLVHNLCCDKCV